jgi:hypothetical protein
MRKLIGLIAAFTLLLMCFSSLNFMNTAFADDHGKLIFSAESNSIWVLNTSTKKLIFVQFEEPNKTWESTPITVPIEFNLDKCVLKAVGVRGTSVFLYDTSSGKITLYKVKGDHTIASFKMVDVSANLK